MTQLSVLAVAMYGLLGAVLGLVYFSGLGWNVRLYVSGDTRCKALAVHVVRLVGIIGIFTLCARQGAAALLTNLAGFLAVRTVAIDHMRSSARSHT